VAVAAVIAYHLGRLDGGFYGVDVFFVVSGFLITKLLLAERERAGTIALGAFWIRRFRRLLPALMVVLVFVMVGSRAWLPAWRLTDIRGDALAALFYVANWRFIIDGQSYFGSGIVPSPLRHTWSLSIEEQFYLVWPFLVVGLLAVARSQGRRVVGALTATLAVASAVWMAVAAGSGQDLSRIYYGTDTRAFALLLGAWLGCWWDPAARRQTTRVARRRRARRWSIAGSLALVPLAVLVVVGTNEAVSAYQGAFQTVAVLSVIAVGGMAAGQGPVAGALASRPLVWIGRRSYGIYLWSWPVQIFAAEHFRLEGATLDVVVVVATVALASLSHWLVEEPVRTGRRPAGFAERRSPGTLGRSMRPAWAIGGVAATLAVVIGVAVGAPPAPDYTRVSDEQALAAALGPMTAEEEAALRSSASSTTTVPVDEGPPGPLSEAPSLVVDPAATLDPAARAGRPLKVMIAGDSVGWSLGWTLGPELTDSVALSNRALIGCGVMDPESSFVIGAAPPERYPDLCQQADLAELRGLSESPDAVLLWLGAWEVYDHVVDGEVLEVGSARFARLLEQRIQERIDRYRAVGAVTVMPVVPCFAQGASRLGTERQDAERLAWVNERTLAVAERNRGWVRLIDPWGPLCTDEGEAVAQTPAGVPLREDGSHFDPPAAVWFWNSWLAGQLGAVFDVPV
jgi:peptidoglycan/LPS O-acetylase OafA/YrhL